MMIRLLAFGVAFALAGCVGTSAEVGGTEKITAVPANHVACTSVDLKQVKVGPLYVPSDVGMFFFMSGNFRSLQSMAMEFDVPSSGRPMNIHYVGSKEALQNGTKQKLIRATADMIAGSVYAWPSEPGYATGCKLEMRYLVDWERAPDGSISERRRPE